MPAPLEKPIQYQLVGGGDKFDVWSTIREHPLQNRLKLNSKPSYIEGAHLQNHTNLYIWRHSLEISRAETARKIARNIVPEPRVQRHD
jgi:hypothetical protein